MEPPTESRPVETHDLNRVPSHWDNDQAHAWLCGWNAAVEAYERHLGATSEQ